MTTERSAQSEGRPPAPSYVLRLIALAARKLLDRSSTVRALTSSALAQRFILIARRRRIVRSRARFSALELAGSKGRTATYGLKMAPEVQVVVRHRTRDIDILDEIFGRLSTYELPPQAAEALGARSPLRVLDLGGNVGLFGAYVLSLFPEARITSLEPDPLNLPLLRRCVASNAPERWTVIEACALNRFGPVSFEGGQFADSHVADAPDSTGTVTGVDVLPLLADADLVKMDIEGSEWPVLLDPRFKDSMGATAFVLEWHTRGCPNQDCRATAIGALERAGYEVLASPIGPWDHGSLWAWRRN